MENTGSKRIQKEGSLSKKYRGKNMLVHEKEYIEGILTAWRMQKEGQS